MLFGERPPMPLPQSVSIWPIGGVTSTPRRTHCHNSVGYSVAIQRDTWSTGGRFSCSRSPRCLRESRTSLLWGLGTDQRGLGSHFHRPCRHRPVGDRGHLLLGPAGQRQPPRHGARSALWAGQYERLETETPAGHPRHSGVYHFINDWELLQHESQNREMLGVITNAFFSREVQERNIRGVIVPCLRFAGRPRAR